MRRCKQCGEERWILDKNEFCIYCSHPRVMGTEVENVIVPKKGGKIVEIEQSKFIKEYR